MKRRLSTIALGCALVSFGSAGPSHAAEGYLDLSLPDFEDGGQLPLKYGGNNPQNPNCTGENASPALTWKNAPAGTKSFAIILFDNAGRAPMGVVHWFAYGLPATKMDFKEGEAARRRAGSGGKSTRTCRVTSVPARQGREGASLRLHLDGA